jgi:predicted dehydrogenase
MHILISGLGSSGRRHLRHFRSLGVEQIDAFRTGLGTMPDAGQLPPDRVFTDFQEALAQQPAAVIIASPTALHVPQALAAVQAGCHVLVEKPVSHSLAGLADLKLAARQAGRIVSVAQNLRYHPVLKMLDDWIKQASPLGEVQLFRAHFGAFLPSWHPWEDYRVSYAARADLGGGCRRTHIHELDYCIWLMGKATDVCAVESQKHPLQTDVDETTAYLLRHVNGALSTITLSLAQTPPSRTVQVGFAQGTFTADLLSGEWTALYGDKSSQSGKPPAGFELEHTYRDQDLDFLRAVRGEIPAPVPLEEAENILEAALTLESQTS